MKKIIVMILGLSLQFGAGLAACTDYSKIAPDKLNNAFIAAVKEENSEAIQKLIQAGADVNTPINYTLEDCDCSWDATSNAFTYAARSNCPSIIKALLTAKKQPNTILNKALDEAIKQGYFEVVEELIKGGVDVNYVDINGYIAHPLISAVTYAKSYAEFSPQAHRRHQSRWQQRRKIIQALLKAGAKVNSINKQGKTALMQAVIEHDLNTVMDLLNIPEIYKGSFFGLGAKPINYADNDGNTAIILAIKHVRDSYTDNQGYNICLSSQKIIDVLLKAHDIDLHHVNNNGETAISLLEALNNKHK